MEDRRLGPGQPPGPYVSAGAGGGLGNSGSFATDDVQDTWHLWDATLQGVVPKNGDLIRNAAGVQWRIATSSYSNRTGRYIINGVQLV